MAPEKRTIDVYATDERDVESIPVFLAYARPYLEGKYIFVGERPMSAKAESVNTPGAYLMKGTHITSYPMSFLGTDTHSEQKAMSEFEASLRNYVENGVGLIIVNDDHLEYVKRLLKTPVSNHLGNMLGSSHGYNLNISHYASKNHRDELLRKEAV